jgi:hypothetical protein
MCTKTFVQHFVENLLKVLKVLKTQENRACSGQTSPKPATLTHCHLWGGYNFTANYKNGLDKNKQRTKIIL